MASLPKRGDVYRLQWYQGETKRCKSLPTGSLQIANQKLWRFESVQFQGHDCPRRPARPSVSSPLALLSLSLARIVKASGPISESQLGCRDADAVLEAGRLIRILQNIRRTHSHANRTVQEVRVASSSNDAPN